MTMKNLCPVATAGACVFSLLVGGCDTDRGGELLAPLVFSSPVDSSVQRYDEPNNTLDKAVAIPANDEAIEGAFHLVSDVDYFRFQAAERARYIIQTGNLEAGVRTRIEVRDSNDRQLASDVGGSLEAGGAQIVWEAPSSGFYFVRVSSVEGGKVGTYTIRISVGGDTFEPDNSISHAHTISVNGVAQQHTIHDKADEDYIAFNAWPMFTYHVRLIAVGLAGNIAFSVLDPLGNSLTAPNSWFTEAKVTVTALGFHYIRVTPRDDHALGTYHLYVIPIDPWEPDSTHALATAITTDDAAQRHSFSSSDDEDYVRFNASEGFQYTIRTDSLSDGVDTQIQLNNPSGAALMSDDNSGGGDAAEIRWIAQAPGDYYVRILSTSQGLPGTYVIRVRNDGLRVIASG